MVTVVAPLAGARIEITLVSTFGAMCKMVAPLAGARIEIERTGGY